MNHIALYRKYRPKSFEEVIGQDHITKTLQNQIVVTKSDTLIFSQALVEREKQVLQKSLQKL